ncbi:MAG: SRPBCC family protein [Thermoleophilaceae bacterium]
MQTQARSRASPAAVWDVLADFSKRRRSSAGRRGRSAFTPCGHSRAGSRSRGSTHRQLGYHILSGFPVADYNALVSVEPLAGGGTNIVWRAASTATLAGPDGSCASRWARTSVS